MNVGLIGASKIANKVMAKSLDDAGFNIVAVAAKDKKNGLSLASRFNASYYSSYFDIFTRDDVDAVYISLPNSFHHTISQAALYSNKHVLLEKPLTLQHSESHELVKIARLKDLSIMENFQFQYHDQFKYITEQITSGYLSNIRSIAVKFGFPLFADKDNIRYQKRLGGGALLDAGAYISKIGSLLMNGDNYKVLSKLSYIDGYDVDMYGSCIITEKDTSFALLGSWGFCNEYQCTLEIWAKDSIVTLERVFSAPPGFNAVVNISSNGNKKNIVFSDNHYLKSAKQFMLSITDSSIRHQHYAANIRQSNLLESVRVAAI